MFTKEHSINIDTPLPLQILCEENIPVNIIVREPITVGTIDKDDKSITIKFVGEGLNILENLSNLLATESSYRNYKYIKPSIDKGTLQARVPKSMLAKCNKGDRLSISSLYVGMVEKTDKSSGILFAVISSVTLKSSETIYEDSLPTQTPDTKSKIKELLDKKDKETNRVQPLEYEDENINLSPDVDPRLLELIEQLIQAINRIADALERIEEKLQKY
eukprot:TRINITY_DN754_c0_g2_i1.p1 TRINITY_DN754_c0_g2~~TRINITY_DN754_c0_g2_i1.p1  ORF type:complete len:218 (+),score=33.37 TRINITY_DN754_c0_g2_i1:21-674(+)